MSDKLRGIAGGAKPHIATHYEAEVRSASDYYPFGLQQYGRKMQPEGYRYGFNGKENDSEWGSQVIQDYGFRIYNPSLGKFLSVDPLSPDYPWFTPYQFAGNTPIRAVDLDGLEILIPPMLGTTGTMTIPTAATVSGAGRIVFPKVGNFTLPNMPKPINVPLPPAHAPVPDIGINRPGSLPGERAPSDIPLEQFESGNDYKFEFESNEMRRDGVDIAPIPYILPKTDFQNAESEDNDNDNANYISIWKAPQRGMRDKIMMPGGFNPENFPLDLPYKDGKAYFAKDESLARDYALHYGEGVIELKIPEDVYNNRLRGYEKLYEGTGRLELPIPQVEFDVLNSSIKVHHE